MMLKVFHYSLWQYMFSNNLQLTAALFLTIDYCGYPALGPALRDCFDDGKEVFERSDANPQESGALLR